jgi:hypothetical protein
VFLTAGLWLTLALLLVVAAVMGAMPELGVACAIVLTPVSGAATPVAVDPAPRRQGRRGNFRHRADPTLGLFRALGAPPVFARQNQAVRNEPYGLGNRALRVGARVSGCRGLSAASSCETAKLTATGLIPYCGRIERKEI